MAKLNTEPLETETTTKENLGVESTCKENLSVESVKQTSQGNAAKTREALMEARKVIKAMGGYWARETLPIIEAALAEPPRNCDVYETEIDRRVAFIAYYNETYGVKGTFYEIDTCDLKHDVEGILHEYIDWLFAKAEGKTK